MTALRALLFPRLSDAALAERAAPYRADLAAALQTPPAKAQADE